LIAHQLPELWMFHVRRLSVSSLPRKSTANMQLLRHRIVVAR
jgi:hypothetical protein